MYKVILSLNVLALFVLGLGCTNPPTEDEKRLLKQLRVDYGAKYRFELFNPLDATYLKIYAINEIDDNEIFKIAKNYVHKYDNLNHIMINTYDKNGEFLYQVHYDIIRKSYYKGYTEYL